MSDVEEAYKEIEKNLDIRVLKLGYIPVNLKKKMLISARKGQFLDLHIKKK